MRRYQAGFAVVCFGILMLSLEDSAQVKSFITHARQSASEAPLAVQGKPAAVWEAAARWVAGGEVQEQESRIKEYIEGEAAKRKEAPVNARVDPVWKAVPGYNGLEVDVEATMELARGQGLPWPPKLLFREVPPQVGLDQLGPYPIYKGNPHKGMVGLMINVAWGDEFLEPMLKTLRDQGVHATFFFDGMWLSKNGEMARRILAEGHEAGNHAYSHKNMSRLDRAQNDREISRTEELIRSQLNIRNKLFAPPSGDFSQVTVNAAHAQKLRTILWTLDTVDWKKPEPSSVVRKVAAYVEPGSLILMHPTASSRDALPGMIEAVKRKKLLLGTVSEVISPARVPQVESTVH